MPAGQQPTDNERAADRFDIDLFRLIERAAVSKGAAWASIALELAATRTKVRAMMSKEDRERTR